MRTLRAARACPDFGSSRRTAGSRLLASLATEREALGERLVVRGACSPEKLIWRWRAISSVLSRREGFRSVSRRWRRTAGDCDAGWCSAKSCATASMADRAGGGRACTRSSAGRGRNDDRCAALGAADGRERGIRRARWCRGWSPVDGDCDYRRLCDDPRMRCSPALIGARSGLADHRRSLRKLRTSVPTWRRQPVGVDEPTILRTVARACVARMNARAHRDRRAWPDPRAPHQVRASAAGSPAGTSQPLLRVRPRQGRPPTAEVTTETECHRFVRAFGTPSGVARDCERALA